MRSLMVRTASIIILVFSWVDSSYALDSYRYLHVTIDTPWLIFIFLLLIIFVPFILMATLAWRYAERKLEHDNENGSSTEKDKK